MKPVFTILTYILFSCFSFAQTLESGEYEFGLKLAFNKETKILSGYFENHTGWDEQTNTPKFSCIFYIKGVANKNKFKILTYYPESHPS